MCYAYLLLEHTASSFYELFGSILIWKSYSESSSGRTKCNTRQLSQWHIPLKWDFCFALCITVHHNEDNNNQIHLQERIKNANKTYFMLQIFFRNENISRKLKLILKNTIIDKMLTYASETSTLTKRDRNQLNIFERKV
jgi:hypothetical protein